VAAAVNAARATGRTAVVAGWDDRARGMLAVADRVKPQSEAAVRRLGALGLETVLLTGDHQATARAVADRLGVDAVAAELLPGDKAAEVRRRQRAGQVVAMATPSPRRATRSSSSPTGQVTFLGWEPECCATLPPAA
jgi:P-type Cu+ transporter